MGQVIKILRAPYAHGVPALTVQRLLDRTQVSDADADDADRQTFVSRYQVSKSGVFSLHSFL